MKNIRSLSACSFLVVLLFSCFYIKSENEKRQKEYVMVENVQEESDETGSEFVLRVNVTGLDVSANITLIDSINSGIGNIFKRNSAEVIRFIHNYGTDNTCVGKRAGNFTMTGMSNTAVGVDCLRFNRVGSRNTSCGKGALRLNADSHGNVAVGYGASQNAEVGVDSVVIGDSALSTQEVGSSNVAVGANALRTLDGGNNNVAVGAYAGYSAVKKYSGSTNIFIGSSAGSSEDPGTRNIYIGSGAGGLSSASFDNIYIGNPGKSESGVIRIGSANQEKCFISAIHNRLSNPGVNVIIDRDGQLGVTVSSRRFKDNIDDIHEESELIYNLNPISFVYKNDKTATKRYGLIAEDVNEQLPELVVKDKNGEPYAVRYEMLSVLLLHEIKKQKQEIELQEDGLLWQKQNFYKQEKDISQCRNDIDNVTQVLSDLQKEMEYFMVAK